MKPFKVRDFAKEAEKLFIDVNTCLTKYVIHTFKLSTISMNTFKVFHLRLVMEMNSIIGIREFSGCTLRSA